MTTQPEPALRILSLGAGVQSTTLLLLSAEGKLPKLDAAIFADTGWEPAAVYAHLDRLEREVAEAAGIPIYRVSTGSLRDDVLNPNKMRSIPAYTMGPEYEVTVVDTTAPCPDEDCQWRILFDAGYSIDLDDVRAGTTLAELDGIASAGSDEDEDGLSPAESAAYALREAGLAHIPQPHMPCESTGQIIVRSHQEKRRDHGMLGRKCTQQYKLRPVLEQVRLLLGAPAGTERPCRHCKGTGQRVAPWRAKREETEVADCSVCEGYGTISRVGQPPKDAFAEQWIGFSTDEITRVSNRGDTRYSRSRHPLLELNMSRIQCDAYLKHHGWGETAKSACIGCPFHGNRHWRGMRDHDPVSWAEAVRFDQEYRVGAGMDHERFLHASCLPLDQAPIDTVQRREHTEGQADIFDVLYESQLEDGDPDGCSPWACRSGNPAA